MISNIIVYVHARRGAVFITAPVVPGSSHSAPSPHKLEEALLLMKDKPKDLIKPVVIIEE